MMTPDDLELLILEAKSAKALQEAFASLSESERKSLSTRASKLRSQLLKGTPSSDASERLKNHLEKRNENYWNSDAYRNASLALYALCPLSALKRSDLFLSWNHYEVFQQIISDRKPEWLNDWIAYDIEQESPRIVFSTLSHWIKEGICNKPNTDGYYRMFAWNMRAVENRKDMPPRLPLSQQLLNEPNLLDDVWRLFEIENQAFDTASWLTANAPKNYETWPDALIKLSNNGHLDRSRLLKASLNGLHQDVKQNQLSGFHKFHEKLIPTKEERLALQPDYLLLLSHPIGHVVKFSLSMLGELEKDKALDYRTFLTEVQSVFFNDTKSNAITALKLIKRIIKKESKLLDTSLRTAMEGIRHPSIDVQNMTFELLKEYQGKLNDDLKNEICNLVGHAAESIKARLDELTNNQSELNASKGENTTDNVFEYRAISPNILEQSILPYSEPIIPIKSVEELISSVSHAVEVVDSPDEIERILDGISRLCGNRSVDFEKKIGPLLHRLNDGGGLATTGGIAGGSGGLKLALADLLLTWLTGKRYQSPNHKYFSGADQLEPAVLHIRKIIHRVAHKKPQPLISFPTHSGGWVDPTIWMDRLIEAEKQNFSFDQMDLCLSLLRLAPDNRSQALKIVSTLSKDMRRIAEFALGGDEKPVYSDRKNYNIWISAARSRDPYADWSDAFEPLKLNDVWADSVQPAAYEWKAYNKEHKQKYNYGGKETVETFKTPKLDIEIKLADRTKSAEKSDGVLSKISHALGLKLITDWRVIPSAALNHHTPQKYSWSSDLNTTWVAHWITYQWPLYPSGCYMAGARQQIDRIDMDGSNWTPTFGFFYGLFQKNRPWCESAHLLLCLGLTAKDADSRGLAVDALIGGIEDGCLDIEILSNTLIRISNGGWIKLNRLGDNLLQASQVSPLHAFVICELIQSWLQSVDVNQHNLFRMLEVLLEAKSIAKQPLKIETSHILKQINGSSKAAKLAKLLIASPH